MDEIKKRLLEKLKKLKDLNDDTTHDEVFLFAIETAIYHVLNYCHIEIEDWLPDLDNTTVLMADDILNEANFLNSDGAEGDVKELTEGDFKISKETQSEVYRRIASSPSFARSYRWVLNRFRKLAR